MKNHRLVIIFWLLVCCLQFGEMASKVQAKTQLRNTCGKYEMQCKSGKCIEDLRRCDNYKDCPDDDDEQNCESIYCNSATHYACSSGECIGKDLVCDGNTDCHGDDDELYCYSDEEGCPKGTFKCHKGRCISEDWKCDGTEDCIGGEDEKGCPTVCQEGSASCNNGECLDSEFFCDGIPDCENGEDEEHCDTPENCNLQHGKFLCKNGKKCLKQSLVCDGAHQCQDGSDESGLCGLRCDNMEKKCNQECFRTPLGPKCICEKGYELANDNTTCKDINECQHKKQVCDHFCKNTEGNFECSCHDEYILLNDGATCRTKGDALMIFSVGNKVEAKYLGTDGSWIIWDGEEETSGVAYDPVEKNVYWISNRRVLFSNLFGNDAEPKIFIHQGLSQPENLIVDWFGRNLYVADYKMKHILACNLETENCKPILKNLSNPRALQVDLANRHLYWSSPNSHKIHRAGLDGSNMEDFVKKDITWANGLAIDYPSSRIYWVDADLNQINSCDLNSSNRKTLPNKESSHAYSLAVWQDRLYWTDWGNELKHHIHSCRKRDGKEWRAEYKNKIKVHNLVIYHESIFEHIPNPCASNDIHKCSHLCLLTPNGIGYKCDCPEEMKLSQDGRNCLEKDHKIPFVAVKSKLYGVPLRHYGVSIPQLRKYAKLDLGAVADMDYNPLKDQIFIADPKKELILVVNLKDRTTQKLIKKVRQPISVAIDWLRDNLYWVNGFHHTVEVARSSGRFRKTIMHEISKPTDLSIDILNGLIFVSDVGVSHGIHKCNLDGEGCVVIAQENIMKPSSVSVDKTAEPLKVYWTDLAKNTIESVDINGKNRNVEFKKLKRPMKIHVDEEHILWTERRSKRLYVATKAAHENAFFINIELESIPDDEWYLAMTMIDGPKINPSDPCLNNTKCHQLCFSKSKHDMICGCAEGLRLEADGSTCTPKKCNANEVKCEDDGCILSSFWCDKNADCEDGSDEKNCTNVCRSNEFACKSGHCISIDFKCDGVNDCPDNSDEDKSFHCSGSQCIKGHDWECKSGECIPLSWRCNPVGNCTDESDEVDCESHECESNEKKCTINGQCISISWWCDDQEDCPNGEDEKDCPCLLNEYKCSNGSCLEKYKLCSGEISCGNETLNLKCDPSIMKNRYEEMCPVDFIPCNGTADSTCVHFESWCNGKTDCPNGEDEDDCEITCAEDYEKCKTGDVCILRSWICDGRDDCLDGSDEQFCMPPELATETSKCSSEEFPCYDGDCIPLSSTCNGVSDCNNGEDEDNECGECSIANGGCEHKCTEHPLKRICSCNQGYELAWDEVSCRDINECQDNTNLCHHSCKNMKGTFACQCKEHFSLAADGVTCKPTDAKRKPALIVHERNVIPLNEDLKEQTRDPLDLPKYDEGMSDFIHEPMKDEIIIIDRKNGVLHVKDSQSNSWTEKDLGMKNISATSLDYLNGNVYVIKAFIIFREVIRKRSLESKVVFSLVKIYNLRNKNYGELFTQPNKIISDIKVSPTLNEMITCENDENGGSLMSRNLYGANERILTNVKILYCESLTIDEVKKRIYWIDSKLHRIESVDILGYDRQRFISKEIHGATGLSMIGYNLLWYNRRTKMLVRCSIRDNSCREGYYQTTVSVVQYQPVYTMDTESPCKNSTCNQLCVPADVNVPHCLCIDGYELEDKLCVPSKTINLAKGQCSSSPCEVGICEQKPYGHFICNCPEGYEGVFCEISVERTSDNRNGLIIGIIIFFLITGTLLAVFLCYKKKPGKLWNREKYRFVNPSFVLLRDEETPLPTTPPMARSFAQNSHERQQFKRPDDNPPGYTSN